MTKEYRWIITNLDAHSMNLEPFKYSGTNITTFRILDTNHPLFNLAKSNDDIKTFDNAFNLDDTVDQPGPTEIDDFYGNNCDSKQKQTLAIPSYPEKINSKPNALFHFN